jgi:hypothetical protein
LLPYANNCCDGRSFILHGEGALGTGLQCHVQSLPNNGRIRQRRGLTHAQERERERERDERDERSTEGVRRVDYAVTTARGAAAELYVQ